jgi:hypothetical protein
MQSHRNFVVTLSAAALLALSLGAGQAVAQAQPRASTGAAGAAGAAQAVPSAEPPFSVQYDGRLAVRADRSATETVSRRIKILAQSAIARVSQQQFTYIDGMESLDIVEAFTEKADGSKVPVGAANIITRDAATGLAITYTRDLKQRTMIFQDVQVGDTLVMTSVKETRQGLFPGQFYYAANFVRSQPITSARMVVEAPADLDLVVRTIGSGLGETIEDVDGIRRHVVTLTPQPYRP